MLNLENLNNDCILNIDNYLSRKESKSLSDTKKIFRILLLKNIRFNYPYTIKYFIDKNFREEILKVLRILNFSNIKIFLNGKNGFLVLKDNILEIEYKKRNIPFYKPNKQNKIKNKKVIIKSNK